MGIAVLSGVVDSLDSVSRLANGVDVKKWESHTPGTVTPTGPPDATVPSRFIACVNREESAQRLRVTFGKLGSLGPSIEVVAGQNVVSVEQADGIVSENDADWMDLVKLLGADDMDDSFENQSIWGLRPASLLQNTSYPDSSPSLTPNSGHSVSTHDSDISASERMQITMRVNGGYVPEQMVEMEAFQPESRQCRKRRPQQTRERRLETWTEDGFLFVIERQTSCESESRTAAIAFSRSMEGC